MMLGASATSVTFADSALAAVAGLRVLAESRPRALPARTPPGTPMQHGQFRGTPMRVSPSARQYDFVRLFLRFCSIVSLLKHPQGNAQETR